MEAIYTHDGSSATMNPHEILRSQRAQQMSSDFSLLGDTTPFLFDNSLNSEAGAPLDEAQRPQAFKPALGSGKLMGDLGPTFVASPRTPADGTFASPFQIINASPFQKDPHAKMLEKRANGQMPPKIDQTSPRTHAGAPPLETSERVLGMEASRSAPAGFFAPKEFEKDQLFPSGPFDLGRGSAFGQQSKGLFADTLMGTYQMQPSVAAPQPVQRQFMMDKQQIGREFPPATVNSSEPWKGPLGIRAGIGQRTIDPSFSHRPTVVHPRTSFPEQQLSPEQTAVFRVGRSQEQDLPFQAKPQLIAKKPMSKPPCSLRQLFLIEVAKKSVTDSFNTFPREFRKAYFSLVLKKRREGTATANHQELSEEEHNWLIKIFNVLSSKYESTHKIGSKECPANLTLPRSSLLLSMLGLEKYFQDGVSKEQYDSTILHVMSNKLQNPPVSSQFAVAKALGFQNGYLFDPYATTPPYVEEFIRLLTKANKIQFLNLVFPHSSTAQHRPPLSNAQPGTVMDTRDKSISSGQDVADHSSSSSSEQTLGHRSDPPLLKRKPLQYGKNDKNWTPKNVSRKVNPSLITTRWNTRQRTKEQIMLRPMDEVHRSDSDAFNAYESRDVSTIDRDRRRIEEFYSESDSNARMASFPSTDVEESHTTSVSEELTDGHHKDWEEELPVFLKVDKMSSMFNGFFCKTYPSGRMEYLSQGEYEAGLELNCPTLPTFEPGGADQTKGVHASGKSATSEFGLKQGFHDRFHPKQHKKDFPAQRKAWPQDSSEPPSAGKKELGYSPPKQKLPVLPLSSENEKERKMEKILALKWIPREDVHNYAPSWLIEPPPPSPFPKPVSFPERRPVQSPDPLFKRPLPSLFFENSSSFGGFEHLEQVVVQKKREEEQMLRSFHKIRKAFHTSDDPASMSAWNQRQLYYSGDIVVPTDGSCTRVEQYNSLLCNSNSEVSKMSASDEIELNKLSLLLRIPIEIPKKKDTPPKEKEMYRCVLVKWANLSYVHTTWELECNVRHLNSFRKVKGQINVLERLHEQRYNLKKQLSAARKSIRMTLLFSQTIPQTPEKPPRPGTHASAEPTKLHGSNDNEEPSASHSEEELFEAKNFKKHRQKKFKDLNHILVLEENLNMLNNRHALDILSFALHCIPERVIAKKIVQGKTSNVTVKYLVKWYGLPYENCTWEWENDIFHLLGLLGEGEKPPSWDTENRINPLTILRIVTFNVWDVNKNLIKRFETRRDRLVSLLSANYLYKQGKQPVIKELVESPKHLESLPIFDKPRLLGAIKEGKEGLRREPSAEDIGNDLYNETDRKFVKKLGYKKTSMSRKDIELTNELLKRWESRTNLLVADCPETKIISLLTCYLSVLFNKFLVHGPFLIITPLQKIESVWLPAFRRWIPDFEVVAFTGTRQSRNVVFQHELSMSVRYHENALELQKFHVLITNPELAVRNLTNFKKFEWRLLIVDEARALKNSLASRYNKLMHIRTESKILITSQPRGDSLKEIWSLLHFLHPEKFPSFAGWREFVTAGPEAELAARTRKQIEPFLFTFSGEEAPYMPEFAETVLVVPFSKYQAQLYGRTLETHIDNVLKTELSSRSIIMNTVSHLKKLCCHPSSLFGDTPSVIGLECGGHKAEEKFPKIEALEEELEGLKREGKRVLVLTHIEYIVEKLEQLAARRGWTHQRVMCQMSALDRIRAMVSFNRIGSDDFLFLYSAKAYTPGLIIPTFDVAIIFDSDWNPYNDLHTLALLAQPRRREKPIPVVRILTRFSIEHNMFDYVRARRDGAAPPLDKCTDATDSEPRRRARERDKFPFKKSELQMLMWFRLRELLASSRRATAPDGVQRDPLPPDFPKIPSRTLDGVKVPRGILPSVEFWCDVLQVDAAPRVKMFEEKFKASRLHRNSLKVVELPLVGGVDKSDLSWISKDTEGEGPRDPLQERLGLAPRAIRVLAQRVRRYPSAARAHAIIDHELLRDAFESEKKAAEVVEVLLQSCLTAVRKHHINVVKPKARAVKVLFGMTRVNATDIARSYIHMVLLEKYVTGEDFRLTVKVAKPSWSSEWTLAHDARLLLRAKEIGFGKDEELRIECSGSTPRPGSYSKRLRALLNALVKQDNSFASPSVVSEVIFAAPRRE
eukprot:gnl/Chilomastix_cuspidata/4328.p1 GENE.gnl/Chilomastix_cuspidata/4328~~gnl/Chilomastix_cuspidata/4328.p1  ORF type:complete len:2186 (-),score=509.35 gnl/Chilomastix_cuspidata/4328:361-6717(-)